jgi:hypothetical protein
MPFRSPDRVAFLALRGLMHDRGRLLQMVADLGTPEGDERRWVQLANTSTFDAWLIAWGGASVIPAHDHAGSAAAIEVLFGELVEWSRPRLSVGAWSARSIDVGAPVVVAADCVHHIENGTSCPAVSIHVYSPPLAAITFHEDLAAGNKAAIGTRTR